MTCGSELASHSVYDDIGITHSRFAKWAPLNQSLYVGYKVMLAGLLLNGKGDRVAMNSSVEARYPLLDDDVIQFSATIAPEYKLRRFTDKWLLRQVAARTLAAADRQPAQDDVPGQPVRRVPGQEPPGLGRSASVARSHWQPRAISIPKASPASVPRRSAIRESPPSASSWT